VRIGRQFTIFTGVGLVVVAVHYGTLVALVESGLVEPVKANLASYVAGGIVSYLLNRRWTFRSERVHTEAAWRFAVVAGCGFLLTGVFTYLFHERLGAPYLVAAIMTSAVVLWWHFAMNRFWTFPDAF
jgi:putative flippase GtrA